MRTNLFCVPITTPATSTYVTNAITEKKEEKIQTFPFPPKTTTTTRTRTHNTHTHKRKQSSIYISNFQEMISFLSRSLDGSSADMNLFKMLKEEHAVKEVHWHCQHVIKWKLQLVSCTLPKEIKLTYTYRASSVSFILANKNPGIVFYNTAKTVFSITHNNLVKTKCIIPLSKHEPRYPILQYCPNCNTAHENLQKTKCIKQTRAQVSHSTILPKLDVGSNMEILWKNKLYEVSTLTALNEPAVTCCYLVYKGLEH